MRAVLSQPGASAGRDWVGDACGDDELKKTVDFAGFRERLRVGPGWNEKRGGAPVKR